tara:strand:- start:916 stop:1110 length:195 start_codon:yes stop_codon:yes gene_type:complete
MQWGGIMKAKKKNNQWEWESVKITLTDPNGETIILNSLDLSDYCNTVIYDEIQFYVDEKGGELK